MDVDLPESLRGSFGHAVPGVEHKIIDPETSERLPLGEPGEICVRGYSLMQGLYKVERSETFDADGFYHTGDAGYFDIDGVLFFQARLGEMIKTGGANVTPREVEAALEAIESIREAYVVGIPDADRGEIVAAGVVLQGGETSTADALRAALKQELSAYKVPREIHFFEHEALPFTDSGKLDKRALVELISSAMMA
jgi:acyl-CoA synthetase (AMP-forming)/AMP-acid ligase II